MAVDANSYGTAAGVAVYAPMHANSSGTFDASTDPALATVEAWIDQLSAAANLELANYGYSTPTTGDKATWLTGWVNQEVAAQIRAVYSRTERGPLNEGNQSEGPRSLLTNIGQVRDMLQSLTTGKSNRAGSVAVTRADAYSSEYSTTDVDT